MRIKRFLRWVRLEVLGRNRHGKRLLAPYSRFSPFRNAHSPRRIAVIRESLGLGQRYLEIGVQKGFTLEAVAGERVGVDPYPRFDSSDLPEGVTFFEMKSRDFFSSSVQTDFDLIFLDGLHTSEETYHDFVSSLRVLSPKGAILIDDVLPSDEPSSLPNPSHSKKQKRQAGILHNRWYGDVWRLAYLIMFGPIAPAFRTLLIGSGKFEHEHSQLLVVPVTPAATETPRLERDLSFMKGLHFDKSVYQGEKCLFSSAVSEEEALGQLSTFSLR